MHTVVVDILHQIRTDIRISVNHKNSRPHLDRLQNKYTNYKGIKNKANFGQITAIQEELDITCK